MILVDTDVLIDCLRGTVAAQRWVKESAAESLAIPGVAAMELIVGCRHQGHLEQVKKFLSAFPVVWPDAADSKKAYELLVTHRLSSGLGIPDCIIAATALNRQVPVYTFNVKHFGIVSDLDVRQPYSR